MAVVVAEVALQLASQASGVPAAEDFRRWVGAALDGVRVGPAQLTVRVVDEAESAELNQHYRQRQGPTNVLSFPFEAPPGAQDADLDSLLGDLVICAPVVSREARTQGKAAQAHWAHMAVHGTLHLLGHDHEQPEQAGVMEALEVDILAALGYADPYGESDDG